jgi:4-carboxymuconolactone decarboxylase
MTEYKETLRKLTLSDESFMESVLGMGRDTAEVSGLDAKTHALAGWQRRSRSTRRPAPTSRLPRWLWPRAPVDELVGTLIAVAPAVGLIRVVPAAPELALALGYEVDAALKAPTRDPE